MSTDPDWIGPGAKVDKDIIVLIVENAIRQAKLLESICGDVGVPKRNIQVERNLDHAEGLVSRGTVDVVLLDLADVETPTNPSRGIAMLQNWRHITSRARKQIPVIVVSGYSQAVDAAARQWCFDVIHKPDMAGNDIGRFKEQIKSALRHACEHCVQTNTVGERFVKTLRPSGAATADHGSLIHVHVLPGISVPIRWRSLPGVTILIGSALIAGSVFAEKEGWPQWLAIVTVLAIAALAIVGWAVWAKGVDRS